MKTTREQVLEAARYCTIESRPAQYSPPAENFYKAAVLLDAWNKISPTEDFTPFDYAVYQILTKLARLAMNPSHFDSWVDIAGYAACGAEITYAAPTHLTGVEKTYGKTD